jgi:hypothetical protein
VAGARLLEVDYQGGSMVVYSTIDGTVPLMSFNMAGAGFTQSPPDPPILAKRYMTCRSGTWALDAPQPNPTPAPSSLCPQNARQFQYDAGWPGVAPGFLPTPNAAGDIVTSQVYRVHFSCGTTRETMTVNLQPGTYHLLLPWPNPFIPNAATTPGPTAPPATSTPVPPTPGPVSLAFSPSTPLEGSTITVNVTAPGVSPQEWVALYRAADADPIYSACPMCWLYLNGLQTPPVAPRTSATLTFPAPPAGSYNFRIFASNGSGTKLFQSPDFTTSGSPTAVPPSPTSPPATPTRTPTVTATPPPALVLRGVTTGGKWAVQIPAAGDFEITIHVTSGSGAVTFIVDHRKGDVVNLAPGGTPRWVKLVPYLGTGTSVYHFEAGVHVISLGFETAQIDAVNVTAKP